MTETAADGQFFSFLKSLKRAWRLALLFRLCCRAACAAVPVATALYSLHQFFPEVPVWSPAAVLPVSLAAALVPALILNFSAAKALHRADAVFKQHSALLTAYRLYISPGESKPVESLFLGRVVQRCAALDARRVFPLETGLSLKLTATAVTLSILFLLLPMAAAPLFSSQKADLTGELQAPLAELEQRAAELADTEDLSDRELAARMEGLVRRLVERSITKRDAQAEVQMLKRDIQRRIEGLERDVIEDALPPEQQEGLSPEDTKLALRRSLRPEQGRSPQGVEGIGGGAGSQPHSQALSALDDLSEELADQMASRGPQNGSNGNKTAEDPASPDGESAGTAGSTSSTESAEASRDGGVGGPPQTPGSSGTGENTEAADSDGGRSTGTTGSLAGETTEADRFQDSFEFVFEERELPSPQSLDSQDEEQSGSLEPDTRIVTRSEAEVGSVRLETFDLSPEFVQSVEGVMNRYRIPIDEREIASEYLYSVGISEAEQKQ